MTLEHAIIIYLGIGFWITLFMIKFYREDGQSKKNGELYFAAIGALIWPLQLLAFIRDWWNKK